MVSKKTFQYMTLGWVTTFLGIWELTDGISSDYEWQFEAVLNLFEGCYAACSEHFAGEKDHVAYLAPG